MVNSTFELSNLNGSNGFIIKGINAHDLVKYRAMGDINNDGYSDIIIGSLASPTIGREGAGQTYVVFGKEGGFISPFDLSTLNGSNGFIINGINAYDYSYPSNTVGDINNDGYDDILISAYKASANGKKSIGQSYVIFG